MSDKKKQSAVIVIVGPTAVGKTDLAIGLAQEIGGEIISADSRLFYRGMNIGTAKPTLKQRSIVPHHLIDVADPEEVWSLSIFQKEAIEAIKTVQGKGKVALLVGGTGQYVHAVIQGWTIPPQQPNPALRDVLTRWGEQIGDRELHYKLSILDPEAAHTIEYQNIRRTIRALEVIFITGKRFSEQRIKGAPEFKFWMIGLTRPRAELYARIDERIDQMFAEGFLEECKNIIARGLPVDHPNLSAIGYREVCSCLRGEISLEEAKTLMKRKTRAFVRRQYNWFKLNDANIHWYGMDEKTLPGILNDLRIAKII